MTTKQVSIVTSDALERGSRAGPFAPSTRLTLVNIHDVIPEDPSSSWLIEGVWPESGVGIVGGPPKVLKSWLATDAALAVASGMPFLGQLNESGGGLPCNARRRYPS